MSWMKTSTVLLVLILAVVMMTAGCTQTPTTTPTTTAATTAVTPLPTTIIVTMAPPAGNATGNASMANPASVYCVQVGGNLSIKKDAQGNEYGVCNFPNGTSVDEWALFRGETNLTATNTTAKISAGNMTKNATQNMTANMTAAKGAVNKTNST